MKATGLVVGARARGVACELSVCDDSILKILIVNWKRAL